MHYTKMSDKKSREPAIRWSSTDTAAITSWFCHRDRKGVAINYHSWTTENHLEQADRMLIDTELHLKPRVTKKKAADKLVDMIKLYKDWRGKAVNTSSWGLDEEGHAKNYLEDGKETGLTIKAFLLKKCPWYYAFDSLYGDHPTVNPAGLVESGQPSRRHGREVPDEDFGGYESDVGEVLPQSRSVLDQILKALKMWKKIQRVPILLFTLYFLKLLETIVKTTGMKNAR